MERYANRGGDSNIAWCEIAATSRSVQFTDGPVYMYTYQSTGSVNIKHMKQLARSGQGLNSFINRSVRKAYVRRLR